MSRPTSARGRTPLSSPNGDRRYLSTYLLEDRNNEASHKDALDAAQVEHDRVREAAIRVFHMHELQEEHNRIVEAEKKEKERLKAETLLAQEEKRLQELRAKSIPKPTPPPEPPSPVKSAQNAASLSPSVAAPPATTTLKTAPEKAAAPPASLQNTNLDTKPGPGATKPSPFASSASPQANGTSSTPSPFQKPQPQTSQPTNSPAPISRPTAATAAIPTAKTQPVASVVTKDRYLEIHQELKNLRKRMQAEAKTAGPPLKGQMGDFRRVIRVSVGQLTGGRGANAQPISKITGVLKEALEGKVPSSPVDVRLFTIKDRAPVQDATNNGPQLPSLFIYLLNICAKAILNQFINEGGANPKAADPVGVFAAHIFSNKDFQWRGLSLIDILMAKFRVACPVLFGFRGNDKMERGRLALGWRRDEAGWISEQAHNNRMTGLGAGFASISLRDFSKASKANPYPPWHYWKAFAYIVNTPANETSNTQYVVLRAMIEGHEQRFLNFYGTASLAALRLALVDFPKRAPANAPAAASLEALSEVLRNEGLVFS